MLADISNGSAIGDYLPMLNGSIFADLCILGAVLYTPLFQSKYLIQWYNTYRLSAVIADVLILVIGMIIARYLYSFFFREWGVWKFIVLLVSIQIIHDILFYIMFQTVPRGTNSMLDLFKRYAGEVGVKAIAGDSFMIIIAALASMWFASQSPNTNIISLICMVYIIPYIIHTN